MTSTGIVVVAALVYLFAVFSKRLARTPVSGPMLFVTAGLLLGPFWLDAVGMNLDDHLVRGLLEITLALVLFTDATEVSFRTMREEATLAGRLLGIGMPLTMALGGMAAVLMFTDLSVWEALLIGVMLAPTDAALGQAIVSNRRVPERIRQALNVESGLNDGLAVPIFALVLAAAEAEFAASPRIVLEIGIELLFAIAAGLVIGSVTGWFLTRSAKRGWVGPAWRSIVPAAVAIGCYGLADWAGASGFLAAFVGGMTFGAFTRVELPNIVVFSDGAAHLLTMLSFLTFGAVILAPELADITWQTIVFAVLALTVLRMAPVAISMIGSRLEWQSVLYVGWFGPRGLASIVFGVIVATETELPGREIIILVTAVTVALSVYAHGATAWWGSNAYAEWFESMGDEAEDMTEGGEVDQMVQRSRLSL